MSGPLFLGTSCLSSKNFKANLKIPFRENPKDLKNAANTERRVYLHR